MRKSRLTTRENGFFLRFLSTLWGKDFPLKPFLAYIIWVGYTFSLIGIETVKSAFNMCKLQFSLLVRYN